MPDLPGHFFMNKNLILQNSSGINNRPVIHEKTAYTKSQALGSNR